MDLCAVKVAVPYAEHGEHCWHIIGKWRGEKVLVHLVRTREQLFELRNAERDGNR